MTQELCLNFENIHALVPLTVVRLFMFFLHAHNPYIDHISKILNHIEPTKKTRDLVHFVLLVSTFPVSQECLHDNLFFCAFVFPLR